MKLLYLLPLLFLVGCDFDSSKSKPKPCSVYVTWEAPIFRSDGSRINPDELEKFTIYVNRTAPRTDDDETLILVLDITDTSLRGWEIPDVGKGQRYFYMTVTDTEGNTSGISNVLGKLCR